MNRSMILMFLSFCSFLSPVITLGSYAYDSVLRLDEATMSSDQLELFQSFLGGAGIDPMGYEHFQWCRVGVNRAFSEDTSFGKFIKRCFSEFDTDDIRLGCAPLDIRTERFGDTMRMCCMSQPRDGINNLYVRIEVIPWRPGS